MTTSTPIYRALDRVNEERTDVSDKLAAFDRFDDCVRELDSVAPIDAFEETTLSDRRAVTGSRLLVRNADETAEIDRVRELFVQIVRPYSVSDIDETEPVGETIEEELGAEIAIALSPSTPGRFTAGMKDAICSAIGRRTDELEAMDRALDIERQSLIDAIERFEPIADRTVGMTEPSLLSLEFDALRDRHETLSAHRSRCEAIVRERQETLHGTIRGERSVSLSHSMVTEYLYRDLSTSYPVLSTVVRLIDACTARERTVRDHLIRRV